MKSPEGGIDSMLVSPELVSVGEQDFVYKPSNTYLKEKFIIKLAWIVDCSYPRHNVNHSDWKELATSFCTAVELWAHKDVSILMYVHNWKASSTEGVLCNKGDLTVRKSGYEMMFLDGCHHLRDMQTLKMNANSSWAESQICKQCIMSEQWFKTQNTAIKSKAFWPKSVGGTFIGINWKNYSFLIVDILAAS